MTAEQLHRTRVVGRYGYCFMREHSECDGRLQAAHVPAKSAMKAKRKKALWRLEHGENLPPELQALAETEEFDLVADGDLGVALCAHHHRLWDLRGQRSRRDQLPRHIERRCRELGLTGLLDELLEPAPGQPDLRPAALR